ncbi:hypothetical protein [Chryseobacterium sp. ON_d1]|uniref:hypothetical protein n=1 Tax=Chryseobacterium sp. ON_d1 TaxID=2583211 RepID=UPI001157DF7C|nr:hypothetical protein [Chryseobacterium sp. ON_d1]GEJ46022.1 hypothetical protein CRS_26300 [Chryseobacterium sp. ON_d1]
MKNKKEDYISLSKRYSTLKKEKNPDLKELKEIYDRILAIDKAVPFKSISNSDYRHDSSSRLDLGISNTFINL